MTPLRLRASWLIVLMLHVQACVSWSPSPLDPRDAIAREEPSRALVIRRDGTEILVEDPRVRNDSILSASETCRTAVAAGGRRVCQKAWTPIVALGDVEGIELERTDPVASLAMGALVLAGLFALLMVMVCAGDDDGGIGSPCG